MAKKKENKPEAKPDNTPDKLPDFLTKDFGQKKSHGNMREAWGAKNRRKR